MLCHNDSDVFEIQFACQRIGANFLPVNWRLALPELEFIGNDATPRVLAYGTEFAQTAAEVARRCGIERHVNLINGAASDYETGLARAEDGFEAAALDITDTWMIMYTSGTTGRPKGARITHLTVFVSKCTSRARLETPGVHEAVECGPGVGHGGWPAGIK